MDARSAAGEAREATCTEYFLLPPRSARAYLALSAHPYECRNHEAPLHLNERASDGATRARCRSGMGSWAWGNIATLSFPLAWVPSNHIIYRLPCRVTMIDSRYATMSVMPVCLSLSGHVVAPLYM